MLSLTELAALGLAAARATQLGVDDLILDPARARLAVWQSEKLDSKIRQFFVDLVGCLFCLGYWLSGVTLLVYLLAADSWDDAPWIIHGVEWFAIAAVQMVINYRMNTWGTA